MMYVMIVCSVSAHHLERIEWQAVSTMIVDILACSEGKDENGLPDCKASKGFCNNCT
jgi:hypothetical protein